MSNVIQAIGGIMNLRWVVAGGVSSGVACTIQAAFKEFGNVRELFILDREGWVLTPLRLEQPFSVVQLPPTPLVNSFFVSSGRGAHATSSSLHYGL